MKSQVIINKLNIKNLCRSYKCELCKASFIHYENYLIHLEFNHESKKKYIFSCC